METTEFKIVGIVESPYYISFERGNSLVGSGKVGASFWCRIPRSKQILYGFVY